MQILEAVVHIKGVVNPFLLEKVIKFIDHKATQKLSDISGDSLKDYRSVKGYQLNTKTPSNMFYWNIIKKEIQRLYVYYKIKFPLIKSTTVNQMDLLKYEPGGEYKVHTDHHALTPRTLTAILNLNNSYEGGELAFGDQKENEIAQYKLGKGDILFFPSCFLYPHFIKPITKGNRYSIVTWLQ